mmetsp:Transcript_11524/g.23631  ORF Transcript_11524/g.23631 Transcript_11524/m.23631 type:complete len:373 (+) Transcript_11524:284-1402(+)
MSVLDLVGGFATRVGDAWYGPPVIPDAAGTEAAYYAKYNEIPDEGKKGRPKILGKGEFGEVRLVRDTTTDSDDIALYAVKVLCKGYSIGDDNTLYRPPNAGVLGTEVDILRTLNGEQWNLRLFGVYEGRRYIYLVTELCLGGDLADYRKDCLAHYCGKEKKASHDDAGDGTSESALLPANIIREVAVRILQAVNHCATHGVTHRDLKPANCMMLKRCDPNITSKEKPEDFLNGLRLIDYGSGCIDPPPTEDSNEGYEPRRHDTMAGSAFYNSPEMFRKSYTYKTDVWSAGVTIYVFAAGFPIDDRLQSVFDAMIKAPSKRRRDLKKNLMPPDADDGALPDTFWEMLDKSLLVYRDSSRPSAGEALKCCAFLQ